MKVDYIKLDGLRAIQDYQKMLADVKQALEQRMNLPEYSDNVRPVVLTWSTLMRTCLLVGLSDATPRNTDIANSLQITKSSEPLPSTFLTKANLRNVFEALIKLRYKNVDADWDSSTFMSKLMMQEVLHGRDLLMKEGGLDQWLRFEPLRGGKTLNDIPEFTCVS